MSKSYSTFLLLDPYQCWIYFCLVKNIGRRFMKLGSQLPVNQLVMNIWKLPVSNPTLSKWKSYDRKQRLRNCAIKFAISYFIYHNQPIQPIERNNWNMNNVNGTFAAFFLQFFSRPLRWVLLSSLLSFK